MKLDSRRSDASRFLDTNEVYDPGSIVCHCSYFEKDTLGFSSEIPILKMLLVVLLWLSD